MTIVALFIAAASAATAGTPVPQEPENDNNEYVLDLATNDYSRRWREVWEGSDNRFRMRVGSNNVAQWFLEEELKFSTSLVANSLRFRFHHARLLRNSDETLTADTFALERRLSGDHYLSVFTAPTFNKAETPLGFALENRRAVDRFSRVLVEFPHVLRNFFEDRKDTSDSLIVVFADRPVRLALDVRERLHRSVWFRLQGELIPGFSVTEKQQATGLVVRSERIEASSVGGWIEYARRATEGETSAAGLEAGYRRDARRETRPGGGIAPASVVASPPEPSGDRRPADGPMRLTLMAFDKDLYGIASDDSVAGWRNTRTYLRPYAWVSLNDRWTVRGAIRFEEREIERTYRRSATEVITNRYVAPSASARLGLGSQRRSVVEFGWASSFRGRRQQVGRSRAVRSDYDDHRLFIAFEYAFDDNKLVRVIESIDLDSEDRGQFGLHDHGFFQLVFGF